MDDGTVQLRWETDPIFKPTFFWFDKVVNVCFQLSKLENSEVVLCKLEMIPDHS